MISKHSSYYMTDAALKAADEILRNARLYRSGNAWMHLVRMNQPFEDERIRRQHKEEMRGIIRFLGRG